MLPADMSPVAPPPAPKLSEQQRHQIIELAMKHFVDEITAKLDKDHHAAVQIVDALLRYATVFALEVTNVRDAPKTVEARDQLVRHTARKLLKNLLTHIKAT